MSAGAFGGDSGRRPRPRTSAKRWRTVKASISRSTTRSPWRWWPDGSWPIAERANTRLAPILGHQPKKRVQIVLTDEVDAANGSATPLHYNTIRLYVSAPDDLSVLGDFDDWLTVLVTHEHAHILHLDNIGGLPAVINKILGKVWAPNMLQPRWIIEGIATYLESRETAGGRLRSTQYEMYMRMAVLEDNILHFDTLNNRTDYWPHGDIWYLYGSRFIHWLVQQYGEEVITEMAEWYGRRAIPFSVNRMAKRLTGKTFDELYALWIADMRRQYGEVEAGVRAQGMTNARRITFHGETVRGLRFAGDDRLLYYAQDGRSDPQIRTLNLANGNQVQRVVRSAGESYPTVHPNGELYFESFDAYKTNVYSYYDLFRFDRRGQWNRKRLTRGLRARYPDISSDGRAIAYVRNDASTQSLWIASLDDIEGSQEVLVQSERFEQVYTPRFSPDGTKVAYSAWRKGGYRDIHVIDLATREITRRDPRSRVGHRARVVPGRQLALLLERPDRYRQHLRLGARDRRGVASHQPRVGRVHPGALPRRHAARVHRLHEPRVRHLHARARPEHRPTGFSVRRRPAATERRRGVDPGSLVALRGRADALPAVLGHRPRGRCVRASTRDLHTR